MRSVRATVACAAVMTLCCLGAAEAGAKLPNDSFLDGDQNGRWDTGAWDQSYDGRSFENLAHLKQTNAGKAWRRAKGDGVVIAVFDTGVDINHPDLAGNIYTNPREVAGNNVDDDGNGLVDDIHGWDFAPDNTDGKPGPDNDPSDRNGHGTAVAGVAAAVQNNSEGTSGVAPNAKIMPIRVTGAGSNDIDLGAAFGAVGFLAANPDVDIVNVSGGVLATDNPNETLPHQPRAIGDVICSLVEQLSAAGKIVVSSAGNGTFNTHPSRDVGSPATGGFAPGYCPRSITATSNTIKVPGGYTVLSGFADHGAAVDVAAPAGGIGSGGLAANGAGNGTLLQPGLAPAGSAVNGYLTNTLLTLRAAGTDGVKRYIGDTIDPALQAGNFSITDAVSRFNIADANGRYVRWRGTSFAAPQVAGAVALMLSSSPGLNSLSGSAKADKTLELVRKAAKRQRYLGNGPDEDYGQLDVNRAVSKARGVR